MHTHVSLQELASSLHLTHSTYRSTEFHPSKVSPDTQVLFLLSVPDSLKTSLLASASLLIYTPQNEHFGIVPLESMLATVPVLAANEGGPLETVVEGKTGWLRDIRKVSQWAEIILKVLDFSRGANGQRLLANMGESGRQRVIDIFSKESMANRIDESLDELAGTPRLQRENKIPEIVWVGIAVVVLLSLVMGFGLMKVLVGFGVFDEDTQNTAGIVEKGAASARSVYTTASASARLEL